MGKKTNRERPKPFQLYQEGISEPHQLVKPTLNNALRYILPLETQENKWRTRIEKHGSVFGEVDTGRAIIDACQNARVFVIACQTGVARTIDFSKFLPPSAAAHANEKLVNHAPEFLLGVYACSRVLGVILAKQQAQSTYMAKLPPVLAIDMAWGGGPIFERPRLHIDHALHSQFFTESNNPDQWYISRDRSLLVEQGPADATTELRFDGQVGGVPENFENMVTLYPGPAIAGRSEA